MSLSGRPIWFQRMALAFDEWARRYAEDPDQFDGMLDEHGNPIENYGERSAEYFNQLIKEMDEANQLPKAW